MNGDTYYKASSFAPKTSDSKRRAKHRMPTEAHVPPVRTDFCYLQSNSHLLRALAPESRLGGTTRRRGGRSTTRQNCVQTPLRVLRVGSTEKRARERERERERERSSVGFKALHQSEHGSLLELELAAVHKFQANFERYQFGDLSLTGFGGRPAERRLGGPFINLSSSQDFGRSKPLIRSPTQRMQLMS